MSTHRSQRFHAEREPFRYTDRLQLKDDKIYGPFSFLNPTTAHFDPVTPKKKHTTESHSTSDEDDNERPSTKERSSTNETPASRVEYKWTSRNNRKGRHALVVQPSASEDAQYVVPLPTQGLKEIAKVVWRMLTTYPFWDVSFDVAYIFTIGSVIWVINAFFALLPFTNPGTSFPGETLYAGGITAFIGATVFEIGSVLLMLEAVNENRAGCFGYALEQLYDGHVHVKPSIEHCVHHHQNRANFVGKSKESNATSASESAGVDSIDTTPPGSGSWVWCPSWYELQTHYIHDLGFIACSSQMFGATVFWISGFTALPGIYTALHSTAQINGAYWVPQVVGGMGFVISGALFMIETQKRWYLPALSVLGWHIGMWNLIGGIGFTLCPIFGLLGDRHWAELQVSCSTFWGSCAFLIGSVIQWYESLDKHPVETASKNS